MQLCCLTTRVCNQPVLIDNTVQHMCHTHKLFLPPSSSHQWIVQQVNPIFSYFVDNVVRILNLELWTGCNITPQRWAVNSFTQLSVSQSEMFNFYSSILVTKRISYLHLVTNLCLFYSLCFNGENICVPQMFTLLILELFVLFQTVNL